MMTARQSKTIESAALLDRLAALTKFDRKQARKRVRAAERQHKACSDYFAIKELRQCQEVLEAIDWLPYELPRFADRDSLTEAERQRYRRAIRKLEADGLVEILGTVATELKITAKGWKAVKAKPR